MKQIRIVFALLVLLAVCLALPAMAQVTITGRVVDGNGQPVSQATVCVKTASDAVMDPLSVFGTDNNGNYQINLEDPSEGDLYIAAYRFGLVPVERMISVTGAQVVVPDLVLSQIEGGNLCIGDNSRHPRAYVSSNADKANYLIDSDITGYTWGYNRSWVGNGLGNHTATIDLDPQSGSALSSEAITIFWDGMPANYTLEVTSDDPSSPTATWTTLYTKINPVSAFWMWGYDYGSNVKRHAIPVQNVRGVRVSVADAYMSVREIMVHSADANKHMGVARGIVKDQSGAPIADAMVHAGPWTVEGWHYHPQSRHYVTDSTGQYELVMHWLCGPATETVYADAWQYQNRDIQVNVGTNSYAIGDIILTDKVETNACVNGDFEQADPGNPTRPANWTYKWDGQDDGSGRPEPVFTWSSDYNHTPGGSKGVCIERTYNDWQAVTWRNEATVVDPTKTYNVWKWHNNLSGSYDKCQIQFTGYDADGNENWNSMGTGPYDPNWEYYSPDSGWKATNKWWRAYGISLPANSRLGIYLIDGGYAASTAAIDDVIFEAADHDYYTISGTVTDNFGMIVPDAIIGLKKSPHATADAEYYAKADYSGYYELQCPAGTAFLAAWKEGHLSSQDTVLNITGHSDGNNLTITRHNYPNIILNRTELVAASTEAGGLADNAVNDVIESGQTEGWATSGMGWAGWSRDPEYYYIRLDGPTDVKDIVMYTYRKGIAITADLEVQVMTNTTMSPMDPNTWANPASGVQTVYTSTHSLFGAEYDTNNSVNVIPISATGITGIRLRYQNPYCWNGSMFTLHEIQVHGPAVTGCTIGGVVVDRDDNPVPGAIVGLKTSEKATADAIEYHITGPDGRYSFVVEGTNDYYVAAWKEGYTTSYDNQITPEPGTVQIDWNLQLEPLGTNFILNNPDAVYSPQSAVSSPAGNAVNGVVEFDVDAGWKTVPDVTQPGVFYIDLGEHKDIADVVIYKYRHAVDNIAVDIMYDGVPSDPNSWIDNADVARAYQGFANDHGYDPYTNDNVAVVPIAINQWSVEGLRITCDSYLDANFFQMYEVQVHGMPAPPYQATIGGFVRDINGDPIPGALVGLKMSKQATADALRYTVTGDTGFYAFSVETEATWYVAAWKDGMRTSGDVEVPAPASQTSVPVNFQLVEATNLIVNRDDLVFSPSGRTDSPDDNAVNGNIEDNQDQGWMTDWDYSGPATFYISLGGAKDVSDIVIYKYWESGISCDDLIIDAISEGNDPTNPTSWENNPSISTVYQGYGDDHGFGPWLGRDQLAVIPISLNLTDIIGLRLTYSNYSPNLKFYHMYEVQVNSGAPPATIEGTVSNADGPFQGAIVGLKRSAKATADAFRYTTTDEDGHYSFTVGSEGPWYVAAWEQGHGASIDYEANLDGQVTDIELPVLGEQIALDQDNVYADYYTDNGEFAPRIFDGLIDTSDACSGWHTAGDGGGDIGGVHYIYVDLGHACDISDLVLYTYYEPAGFVDDFEISVMTSQTANRLDPTSWEDDNNGVSPVYSATQTKHGYKLFVKENEPQFGAAADPIRLDLTGITGLRIKYENPTRFSTLYELIVHTVGETTVSQIGDAKKIGDNLKVTINDKSVTGIPNQGGVPDGFAFIEDYDRASGLKVKVSNLPSAFECFVNQVVDIGGVMRTENGERFLDATWIVPKPELHQIAPVGMNNRFAATNLTQGLYVRVWGVPSGFGSDDTRQWFYLDDGSGMPIKVYAFPGTIDPASTGMVTIKGVTSVENGSVVVYMTENYAD